MMRTTTTVNGLDSRHEIHRMILLVFSVLFLADGYSLFQDYWLSMVARIRKYAPHAYMELLFVGTWIVIGWKMYDPSLPLILARINGMWGE